MSKTEAWGYLEMDKKATSRELGLLLKEHGPYEASKYKERYNIWLKVQGAYDSGLLSLLWREKVLLVNDFIIFLIFDVNICTSAVKTFECKIGWTNGYSF